MNEIADLTQPRLKLYRVTLCGFNGYTSGADPGTSYVVATDPTAAYQTVRAELDRRECGFSHDRELKSVELIADAYKHTDVRAELFIAPALECPFPNPDKPF